MRVFVTGATGYVGTAVVDALQRASHEVVALVRHQEKARRLADRTAFYLGGECVEIGVTADYFTGEVKDQRTRDYVEGRFG